MLQTIGNAVQLRRASQLDWRIDRAARTEIEGKMDRDSNCREHRTKKLTSVDPETFSETNHSDTVKHREQHAKVIARQQKVAGSRV